MTAVQYKMKCPKCGAEMNCHAEKIVYEPSARDETVVGAGTLLEFHACPNCGAVGTRDVRNPDH